MATFFFHFFSTSLPTVNLMFALENLFKLVKFEVTLQSYNIKITVINYFLYYIRSEVEVHYQFYL